MKYYGQKSDLSAIDLKQDSLTEKKGVLLVNLGTPDQPKTLSLRKYLAQFLMDPRVVEIPALLRFILVKVIIVNFRASKSAASYREVWTNDGSPLLTNTTSLTEKVEKKTNDYIVVDFAMRYGNPSINSKLREFHDQGIRDLTIIPLYPQYSGSCSGAVFDDVAKSLTQQRWVPSLRFIDSYYQNPKYISAISSSVKSFWSNNKPADLLLISFHGIPQSFVDNGDPYQMQCQASAQQIAQALGLEKHQWKVVFQSRFGKNPWIQPACDATLKVLASQDIKSVDVICPGFSADCLETLEEIKIENRDYFLNAGGERYNYIPCLNDSDEHVALLIDLIS